MNFFPSVVRRSISSKFTERLTLPIIKSCTALSTPVATLKTQPTYDEDQVPECVTTVFNNRNPRNLEMLRIADKPLGFHLDKPGREFWHKLEIIQSSRYVTCRVIHNSGKVVIAASSAEWPLKKRLFSYQDKLAYVTLGKVLAQRCLESGINSMLCNLTPPPGGKLEACLNTLKEEGVSLEELPAYRDPHPMSKTRPEKPGTVEE